MKTAMQNAAMALCVACIWWTAYRLNVLAFQSLDYSARATWIFLPAALRIIAVLLLDNIGVVGLILGAYMTLPHGASTTLLEEAGLAASSGVAPLMAILLCRRFFSLSGNLAGLRPWHIVALSVSSALANSVILNGYLTITGRTGFTVKSALSILVGDIAGSAITLLVLSAMFNLLFSDDAFRAHRQKIK